MRLWKAYHFVTPIPRRVGARRLHFLLIASALVLAPAVGDARLGAVDTNVHAAQSLAAHLNAARSQPAMTADARGREPDSAKAVKQPAIRAQMAELLQLANQLQSDVDKTNKDTLSLSVVRKADAIETLARTMKAERPVRVSTEH